MRFGKFLSRGSRLALGTVVACAAMGATASAALAADYAANVTPDSVAPGSSTTFTVALLSESSSNPLNAALITPPQNFTITAADLAQPSGNATVAMQNGQVVVKGLSLKNKQSASVLVTATAPSGCAASSWGVQAFKSSLNGPQLVLDTQHSILTATVRTSSCPAVALRFATQPTNTTVGQTISGATLNPLGSPVTVDVVDGAGSVVTSSSAAVTISQNTGPAGATLGGTATQTAVNGVATFNNLTLNTAGTYTLVTKSSGLTNATSNPFVEVTPQTQTTNCPGGSCTLTVGSPAGTTPSSSTVTTTGQKGAKGTLSLSVDVGTKPVCNTLAGTPYQGVDQNFYSALYTPTDNGNTQVAKTIMYTIFNTGGHEGINLCFAAPYPFEQLDDSPAVAGTLPDGSPGFVGLLEKCDPAEDGATPDPCQTVATVADPNGGTDTVFTITIPAGEPGDPAWGA
jgi:hypothetical protein